MNNALYEHTYHHTALSNVCMVLLGKGGDEVMSITSLGSIDDVRIHRTISII